MTSGPSALEPRAGARRPWATTRARPSSAGGAGVAALLVPLLVGAVTGALAATRLLVAGDVLQLVWAEDGRTFLGDAESAGASSLWRSYAGYAHTLPRLIALVGAAAPLSWYAALTVVTALVVLALAAAFVHAAARELTGSWAWALVPALSLALVPSLGVEALGNAANLQWTLIAATPWALVLSRQSPLRWLGALVAVVAAATTPLVAVVLPVALVVHRWRVVRSLPVLATLLGLALQVLVMAFGPESDANPLARDPGASPRYVAASFLALVTGPRGLPWRPAQVVGALVLLLALVACLTAGERRLSALCLLASGLLLYVVVVALNGSTASRYEAVAAMLVLAAVALSGPRARWWTATAAVTLWALSAVVAFPAAPVRVSGPSWPEQVRAMDAACRAGAEGADLRLSPEGWGVVSLPCAALR